MTEPTINPDEDGRTHINIYSRGGTELGRLLSNFAHTPFVHPSYGHFSSVEGFWYWLKTGKQHDSLRHLASFAAKKEGKTFGRVECENFNEEIKEAIRLKLRTHKNLRDMLTASTLPLKHYYYFGAAGKYKVMDLPQYQWIVDEIERIRQICQEHRRMKYGA